jgi:hypothetical protein
MEGMIISENIINYCCADLSNFYSLVSASGTEIFVSRNILFNLNMLLIKAYVSTHSQNFYYILCNFIEHSQKHYKLNLKKMYNKYNIKSCFLCCLINVHSVFNICPLFSGAIRGAQKGL